MQHTSLLARFSRRKLTLLVAISGLVLFLGGYLLQGQSVRAELARLQGQTGLSLITVENRSILVVDFSRRSVVKVRNLTGGIGAISPDGTMIAFVADSPAMSDNLAVSGIEGSDFRVYRNVRMPANNCICWSPDNSKMVIGSMNIGFQGETLRLLEVSSGAVAEIAKGGRVTSQCWSPDSKHFVYEDDGQLRVYDTEENRSQNLKTKGDQATWSPNGKRIAFLDSDTYYAMDPTGIGGRQALFKKWQAQSGLWWSPDSRFVAYVSQAGWLEGGLLVPDSEVYWLRVRRLQDNSETKVAGATAQNYEWVTKEDLLRNAPLNLQH